MDYDRTRIAATYDTGRRSMPGMIEMWLDAVAAHLDGGPVATVVDVGCGTGRYTVPLHARFGGQTVGVEPSARMLAEAAAKRRPGLHLARAPAEALPLADASADLAFMSMVFHHLADPPAALAECARVLRPGGRLAIRTSTAEAIPLYPYREYFEGVEAIMRGALPTRREIADCARQAGLDPAAHEVMTHAMAPDWTDYTGKLAQRADSFLAALPDAAFETGLAAMRAAAAAHPGPVTLPLDLFVFARPG